MALVINLVLVAVTCVAYTSQVFHLVCAIPFNEVLLSLYREGALT